MTTSEPGFTWRTSSYSTGNGNCVEVGWQTSSHSAGQGNCIEVGWKTSSYTAGNGACVEVKDNRPEIHVRDTKDREGGQLAFGRETWRAFLALTA